MSILDKINSSTEDLIEFTPFCQLYSGKVAGIFISKSNGGAVDFSPGGNWKPHTYTFRSGDSEEGWLCQSPRFLVVGVSPVGMFCRGTNKFIAEFDKGVYKKDVHYTKTKYAFIFLNENNVPLHRGALVINFRGYAAKAFSDQLKAHRDTFCSMFNKRWGTRFFRQVPTEVHFKSVEVGVKPNVSTVAYATGYEAITPDNVESNYIDPEYFPELYDVIEETWGNFGFMKFKPTKTEEGYAAIGTAPPESPKLSVRTAELLSKLSAATQDTYDDPLDFDSVPF